MINRQLELRLENGAGLKPTGRNHRRSGRARWWFARMRGAVDEARDWPVAFPPGPAPRPGEVPASADAPSMGIAPPTKRPSARDSDANAGSAEPPGWKFGLGHRGN